MKLFDMTEADIQRAEDAYTNRLYDIYYGTDAPEPCCENCAYYSGGFCSQADGGEDKEVDDDDYCELHEYAEAEYGD